jgi:hypothetical protein
MANWENRTYRVLQTSHINGAIAEVGEIVTIKIDRDTWRPGPNLQEVEVGEQKHTPAQQAEGDGMAALTKEAADKQAAREAKPEAEEKLPLEPEPPRAETTPEAPQPNQPSNPA